jgi:glucosylceramidase
MMRMRSLGFVGACSVVIAGILLAQTSAPIQIESWVTNQDRSSLFQKQPNPLAFQSRAGAGTRGGQPIVVDETKQMQSMDGFGYALTGGSAELLVKMSKEARAKVLKELFATDENNVGVSYLRLSIGASDLNSFVFSYDDLVSCL